MKEHSFFLRAGFLSKDEECIKEAEYFQMEFEKLLCDVVKLSNGIVRNEILCSGEVVTEYTLGAEKQTEKYTGISLETNITLLEQELRSGCNCRISSEMVRNVRRINKTALKLLDGLIHFKKNILNQVLSCKVFTVNYPLLIEHILREANLYRSYVVALENGQNIECKNMRQVELFWNQIMMEHAEFIRGLLDPCEEELIETSNDFAEEFCLLLREANEMNDETIRSITNTTIRKTEGIRDFKAAGAKGLTECKIRSIILPLLADHVLREANHYLRLLKS